MACDLDTIPEDSITPEVYFKTETDLRLWTNQFYSQLDDAPSTTCADDYIYRTLGDVITGTRSAADESGWTWTHLRRINYYLESSVNCENESVRAHYDGVAYFFRAYFYYVKVRRYGDVPWYDYVLASDDEASLRKPRDDRGYVMDMVMEDLDRAIASLGEQKEIARVTKWTALAFKSRAALYEGTFRKYHGLGDHDKYLTLAAEAAGEFIAGSGYGLYTSGSEPYRELFYSDDAKQDEVILARLYNFDDLNLSHSIQFNIENNQQSLTRRFMNHYLMADGSRFTDIAGHETMPYTDETAGRDPRMQQTVLCPGYVQVGESTVSPNTLLSLTGYQPIKFVSDASRGGASKGTSDWPLFRTAEVYLNYAEAKAELGTLTQDDIDKTVNRLRDRAGMPHLVIADANNDPDPYLLACYPKVTRSANTGVILEIRRERTVELVMENFRLWDMLRWKEGAQMVNATNPYYGVWFPGPGTYDMDLDGQDDLELYVDDPVANTSTRKKIGSDVILSDGTAGYVWAYSGIKYTWNEERDYLWPIPADERVLSGGVLTQNPGWSDSTNFD
ncbi:MAG: RagB/SusD family nutrient uptake outer membrane protein [Alistipes sp.]|nr:RagB/SusD family nutrient uptake outer membrane protein [Alistipes sp.]